VNQFGATSRLKKNRAAGIKKAQWEKLRLSQERKRSQHRDDGRKAFHDSPESDQFKVAIVRGKTVSAAFPHLDQTG